VELGFPSFSKNVLLYLSFLCKQAMFENKLYNLSYDLNKEQCSWMIKLSWLEISYFYFVYKLFLSKTKLVEIVRMKFMSTCKCIGILKVFLIFRSKLRKRIEWEIEMEIQWNLNCKGWIERNQHRICIEW
jgi:hypothetical protein